MNAKDMRNPGDASAWGVRHERRAGTHRGLWNRVRIVAGILGAFVGGGICGYIDRQKCDLKALERAVILSACVVLAGLVTHCVFGALRCIRGRFVPPERKANRMAGPDDAVANHNRGNLRGFWAEVPDVDRELIILGTLIVVVYAGSLCWRGFGIWL